MTVYEKKTIGLQHTFLNLKIILVTDCSMSLYSKREKIHEIVDIFPMFIFFHINLSKCLWK